MAALNPYQNLASIHPLNHHHSSPLTLPPFPNTNSPPDHQQNVMFGAANQPSSTQQTPRPTTGTRRVSSAGLLSANLPVTATNGAAVAVPAPIPAQPTTQTQPPGLLGMPAAPFEGSRSPPGSKNLSHVPCKFFRQGGCQAGKACPFLHSSDPTTEQAPCKYFQKGNCKFGVKCALAHILPDGRRISRHSFNHLGLGVKTYVEPNHTSRSVLHNSLVQAQMIPHARPQFGDLTDDYGPNTTQKPQNADPNFSNAIPDPQFASPRVNEQTSTMAPLASSIRTLGPLDATLPSSLDSNGISWYARHGPIAASVPSKFGMESPPMSLPGPESRALRSLHASAFGEEDTLGDIARSPPVSNEDTLGHRLQSQLRGQYISSSMPRPGLMLGNWDKDKLQNDKFQNESLLGDTQEEAIGHEEDFIPGSLTGEILTPLESVVRNRRMSGTVNSSETPRDLRDSGSAVGSPPVGSPSRFGPLFMRTKREEDHPISGLGHVGSPLRNSYLQDNSPPSFSTMHKSTPSGDASSSLLTSPPRVSALTQTLQRARISRDNSFGSEAPQTVTASKPNGRPMERAISSSSTGGKPVSSIDEEIQFSMDDEESNGAGAAKHAAGAGAGAGAGPGPIPIGAPRRQADDDWKNFAKRDVKPLR